MNIKKAVVTAAAKGQRNLPMQTLIDGQGNERSVLAVIIQEALRAGVEEIAVVVHPGDADAYGKLVEGSPAKVRFIEQKEPRGYGHAVWCARDFTGADSFLHLVGDHIYVRGGAVGSAQELVEAAAAEDCAVSGVQVTRENLLPYYGTVGGQRVAGSNGLYRIETVIEKPTPTEAEQSLAAPGLRSGQYLCFYGMHVLSPAVMEILERLLAAGGRVTLSEALAELARRERYLALIQAGRRFDVGVKYGLFEAQLAIGLSGEERDVVLARLLDVLANREAASGARA
ncbi:MAG: NTP transferase domain-containing protein [Acidobacteria bacterium]|nr:NTP transferase domain-containing protein [Acidobacteriota bacterium]